jgi:hypothetical protein
MLPNYSYFVVRLQYITVEKSPKTITSLPIFVYDNEWNDIKNQINICRDSFVKTRNFSTRTSIGRNN